MQRKLVLEVLHGLALGHRLPLLAVDRRLRHGAALQQFALAGKLGFGELQRPLLDGQGGTRVRLAALQLVELRLQNRLAGLGLCDAQLDIGGVEPQQHRIRRQQGAARQIRVLLDHPGADLGDAFPDARRLDDAVAGGARDDGNFRHLDHPDRDGALLRRVALRRLADHDEPDESGGAERQRRN
jgi:hypothetical protein